MESIRELYRIGKGPSSSHTMGPEKASQLFKDRNPQAERFEVALFGSLSKTGKGHMTDTIIENTFAPKPIKVLFNDEMEELDLPHPNTMELFAYDKDGNELDFWRVFSVGGGRIQIEGQPDVAAGDVYELHYFEDIKRYCKMKNLRLSEYVREVEGDEIFVYLREVWETMKAAVRSGLNAEGVLQGGLDVQRKAKFLFNQRHIDESPETKENRLVCAYAFAVSEENAGGGTIVTAPTCGACGVLPAVLKYAQVTKGFTDEQIIRGLATAGIIGNLTKRNASISGAEAGCQAEIGTACSMAAAALAELYNQNLDQVEYAAEVAMEHHLGLTCDPICGLVQIPCIERNAVAANRAMNACNLSYFLTGSRNISYDMVCRAMHETGINLNHRFRETSEGGLAKLYNRRRKHQ